MFLHGVPPQGTGIVCSDGQETQQVWQKPALTRYEPPDCAQTQKGSIEKVEDGRS